MGCFTFVKVVMVLFNLLICLAGMCMASAGIWVTLNTDAFMEVLPPFTDEYLSHVNVGIFSITIGAVMTLLGMLGCCGAQKESKCLLIMTEIILRAWAIPGLKEQYGKDQILTGLWNSTMTTLQCCGFSNYTDFTESYYYKQNGVLYPPTCCVAPELFPCDEDNANFSNVVGCFKQIVKVTQRNVDIVGGIAAGVTAIELAAMGMSMYLYCYLDQKAA
ncbi:tetraspanin-1 isoform X2 [Rhinichthys klamathensis goyatoka]|uniref:tetraspanin-1 isoform X2 n=1 Tax=Rhinichthys klamathensis goyatoka TaxID=3034132 RepID=UPI0024B4CA76|nr:tetraspanin-1 isoform X2 [Rhinichthys klamathensis goyatoka]